MKKLLTIFALLAIITTTSTFAGTPITRVDKVAPTDEIFMDMAVTAAKKSVADGNTPCGAVIILNNAWRSTGTPSSTATAEENAIAKSRRQTLENATIYTIVEPTTETYNTICQLGADAIFFVIPRQTAIEKGIYPASAYDDSKLNESSTQVPLKQMPYADATNLVAGYKAK